MRASEFVVEIDTNSTTNLISILDNLRGSHDQIRVDALVNMVARSPGSEMFNVDLLKDAYDSGELDNIIEKIAKDDTGVLYVYLKPLVSDLENEPELEPETTDAGAKWAGSEPRRTVAMMAKRAQAKRS
jgi:hypothetical protein